MFSVEMPSTQNGEAQPDPCESIQESLSTISLRHYLTLDEEMEIHRQFLSSSWKLNGQVLWSGMQREEAQRWADEHNMQTLTTAMGPLMDPRPSSCSTAKKLDKPSSRYILGASAVFAWHITRGNKVTILCPPPPQRFHPSGLTYFQTIEEPILRAAIDKGADLRLELVHPGVKAAGDFHYQICPLDETVMWTAAYGTDLCFKWNWRQVKGQSPSNSTTKASKVQPSTTTPKDLRTKELTTSAPIVGSKKSPKKSKIKKKKQKTPSVPESTTASPSSSTSSSKFKVTYKDSKAAPPPKALLKVNTETSATVEALSATIKLERKKKVKIAEQAIKSTTVARKRARKRARKARRTAMTAAEKESKLTPKQRAAKVKKKEKKAEKKAKKAMKHVETSLEY